MRVSEREHVCEKHEFGDLEIYRKEGGRVEACVCECVRERERERGGNNTKKGKAVTNTPSSNLTSIRHAITRDSTPGALTAACKTAFVRN